MDARIGNRFETCSHADSPESGIKSRQRGCPFLGSGDSRVMPEPNGVEKDERLWSQNLPPLLIWLHQAVSFDEPELVRFHPFILE